MKGEKMKRIASLILTALMLLTLLASCGDNAARLPKPENGRTVFTVGGKKIKYDYVRYVYLNTKAELELENGTGYWEGSPDTLTELKEKTLETIVHNRAIEMLAERYKIKLTKSEKKAVGDLLNDLKSDKISWNTIKSESFLTDYAFVYLKRFTLLWSKIYDYVTSPESGVIKATDETVLADIPLNFRNIRYVYIGYSDKNKAEKMAIAEEVLAKANGGESFSDLIRTYGENSSMIACIDSGYYYTVGMIDERVENAVEQLKVGEISPIIDVKSGFFIVLREDIDMDHARDEINTFTDYYVARIFNEMVAKIEGTMKIEASDFWNSLKLDDIK